MATTPFCPDGTLLKAGFETIGHLVAKCCSCVMKILWLARLARPHISKPTQDVSMQMTKWSRADDKRLRRLMEYLQRSKKFHVRGYVQDALHECQLHLYVGADFCKDVEHTKSNSGMWLVLVGPNTWFPLAWQSKRQTSCARSTRG